MFKTLGIIKSEFLHSNTCRVTFSSIKMKINKMASIIKTLDEKAEKMAANFIINEEVIAVPTDTVYGIACSAKSLSAVKMLYEIKGRNESKPVAICVGDLEELRKYGQADHLSDELLSRLLPGPVTIVLEQTSSLNNPFLNSHTTKIGIRIPDYPFIQNVASYAGIPVALTSANPSSVPSSLSVEEFVSLHSKLGAVFDGGILGGGQQGKRVGSTVIDLSKEGVYHIVREGIACSEITELLQSYRIRPEQ